jgi:pantoate kinase
LKEAEAFAPCHITGLFQIIDKAADALRAGSRGAGVSLTLGVKTKVRAVEALKNSVQVSINSVVSESAEVSRNVVDAFLSRLGKSEAYNLTVEHTADVPVGAGLGTSGAAALGLALALNDVFDLRLSRFEAAQLAHIAEVECKTGLGTVAAETFGGVEIRTEAGAPGIGEVKLLTVPERVSVACLVFGPISTQKILSNAESRMRINECGGRLVDELIESPTIPTFLKLSRRFAEHVGLISHRMRSILDCTDATSLICSMAMFGESVFTVTEQENVEHLLQIFHESGLDGKVIVSGVDHEGARLM